MSGDKSTNEDMWQVNHRRPQPANLPPKCADPELERIFERIAASEMAKPQGPNLLPATHCKQGHEYAVVGVYQYVNIKNPACRECRKIYRRKWWAVRKRRKRDYPRQES